MTAPDTAGLGGPQPVARITAGPQHRRCHTQWLALVLDALVLPSLLASAIPLAAAQPVQGLRLSDAAVNLAPVLLLAVMVLRLGDVLLDSDADEAQTSGRRSHQLASR